MAPSRLGQGENLGSTRVMGMNIMFAVMWQVWSKRWVAHRSWELVVKSRMMESMSRSDSRDGCSCNYSRCVGRSCGDYGKEAEELSAMQGEGDDQGKLWFKWENSQKERRSLFRLERELDAVLHFKHGDGMVGELKDSPIWITQILLGRLFREHQELGRAVKLYSQFHRHETMRCMVKINDLEEKAEPPLNGTMGASTSSNP